MRFLHYLELLCACVAVPVAYAVASHALKVDPIKRARVLRFMWDTVAAIAFILIYIATMWLVFGG